MPTVLIAGGSGLIGSRLSQLLLEKGYRVIHFSRRPNEKAAIPTYAWDLHQGTFDKTALAQADYVINLAGAGIADQRWSARRKQVIIDSRVKSNALLLKGFREVQAPQAFISASAVGYYGHTGNELAHETTAPGKGFLTESVETWEKSIEPIEQTGMRTIVLRVGIVLSTLGGALEKMLPSYRFGLGAYFGDGQQYYSWIHIDDVCQMFIMALEKETMRGIYNAVGPTAATTETIARSIAKARDQKAIILPAPAFALRLAMGEMADMLLFSTRVSAEKISNAGFQFQFPELTIAIKDLITRKI